ncbi:hypothetical protein M6B38_361330 [Iris pallida]|uniref:Uncharacterized protein n=1 Tax=Iris pallida TaxID=29817 RepID=A0AAX6GKF9_IRIPA|nr:hypothetical protein M6B38_386075 [Iris pallida]KAJ6828805.1 hypothetical protein M6B38_361330 [Iris pallida]
MMTPILFSGDRWLSVFVDVYSGVFPPRDSVDPRPRSKVIRSF